MRDLLWLIDEHPALFDTLTDYLEWRAEHLNRKR